MKPGDEIPKDPDSEEPYVMNWTKWLAGLVDTNGSDVITDSIWSVDGPDESLQIVSESIVSGALKTQFRMSGGTAGKRYLLTNSVISTSGAKDDRSVRIRVTER